MRFWVGVLGMTLSVSACDQTEPGPTEPGAVVGDSLWASLQRECPADAPAPSLAQERADSLPPIFRFSDTNAEWAAIARKVPGGWGGFFYHDGAPTMYLRDPSLKEQAVAALQAEGMPFGMDVVVRAGRWDFAQMYDWYRYVAPHVWGAGGVSSSDVQEARNRLEYGVIDEDARHRVEHALTLLDVPCFLVAIRISPYAIVD